MNAPDPGVRRYQKQVLEQLGKSTTHPVLAEMAKELLAGRMTIQQVVNTGAYMDELVKAGRDGVAKVVAMTDEEREAAAREAREAFDRLPDEEEPVRRRPAAQEDDEPIESFMVRPTGSSGARAEQPPPRQGPGGLPRSVRDRAAARHPQ